ncbi:TPA: hypothetical protein ACXJGM_003102 [Escherichia coli]|uniref:hypothetical protein n=1 Tax=Escherichia coli TaxID=562 RepID=UPI0005CFE6F4|nr:hypothetical protein [Escherichia coli]QMD88971.1 hypothetical protein HVZ27_05050 [Escherichia coli]QMH81157.1 hypothetical protein HVY24_05250 [Escherichia coli]STG42853.1 Uncharacterised protein [Escherichia coli]HAU8151897.1 hypothetical protein [Escherichia coli]HBD3508731.1 hypothetical protein [Escherichia coli]
MILYIKILQYIFDQLLKNTMDSNTLTIIGTFIVAIISGLLAYSSSLSAKEKEVKLSAYEKLGLDIHANLEKLYNNTEWLLLIFQHKNTLNRGDLIIANEQVSLDVDKLRELSIRMRFFDNACYKKYESVVQSHGNLIPQILGYTRHPHETPRDASELYSREETQEFINKLSILKDEINSTKIHITNKIAKEYNKALSSSRKVTVLAFIVLFTAFIAFIIFPLKEQSPSPAKEKVMLLSS